MSLLGGLTLGGGLPAILGATDAQAKKTVHANKKKKKPAKSKPGPQGPAGPQGPGGPQGLQGPPGPVQMAYAAVTAIGGLDPARSSGINGMVPGNTNNVYCFDLTFTPKVAVGSPYINNAGKVATWTPDEDMIGASCPEGFRDAAVKTYSSTGGNEAMGFKVIFV
jgi:hypothetical protein